MSTRISGVKDNGPWNDHKVFEEAVSKEEFPLKDVGRVVIVKPYQTDERGEIIRCPAERCLSLEGIVPEIRLVKPTWESTNGQEPWQYANVLADVWKQGQEFINCEHDMAPWPGALEQLHECSEPLCHFFYPHWPPGYLTSGIGCIKFGQAVIDALRDSWEDWGNCEWWNLDGAVLTQLKQAGFNRHEHNPPVAHVRRPMGVIIS